jgi:hypothetical protein
MVAGMAIATAAIFTGLALGEPQHGAAVLLAQPAVVSVPIAFLVMAVVSLRDSHRPDPAKEMLALHAPEGLGLRLADEDLDAALETAGVGRSESTIPGSDSYRRP